jgi:putative hemolysin
MSPLLFEILIVSILVLLNGIFAMSEIAVVSSRKVRLEERANRGERGARRALGLAHDPSRFLATVQVGITLVGVLAGAYSGAKLSEPLAAALERQPLLAPYSEGIALALVVAAITYLSLVIGELVPKQIGLNHPERIASFVAGPMHVVARAASPLIWLLTASSRLVLAVLGIKKSTDAEVTEAEITAIIEQGAESGVIHESEQEMVERVFWLGDRRAGDLITPRNRLAWIDIDSPAEERTRMIATRKDDTFLVCRGDVDHVAGMIDVRDIGRRVLSGRPFDFESALHQPIFVPESTSALRLLELLHEADSAMAVVVDEYGGVQGVVTRERILEEIAGDDSGDELAVVRRDDGSYLVDGAISIEEFREALGLDDRRRSERGDYRTLGGLIVTTLGRIPRTGDQLDVEGLRLEVVDMDRTRIDKVLVHQAARSGRS